MCSIILDKNTTMFSENTFCIFTVLFCPVQPFSSENVFLIYFIHFIVFITNVIKWFLNFDIFSLLIFIVFFIKFSQMYFFNLFYMCF